MVKINFAQLFPLHRCQTDCLLLFCETINSVNFQIQLIHTRCLRLNLFLPQPPQHINMPYHTEPRFSVWPCFNCWAVMIMHLVIFFTPCNNSPQTFSHTLGCLLTRLVCCTHKTPPHYCILKLMSENLQLLQYICSTQTIDTSHKPSLIYKTVITVD